MNDLSVSLSYLSVSDLRRTGKGLLADPDDFHTPGWFVRAYRNEGYERVVKLTRITDEDAIRVARTIDVLLPCDTPELARAVTLANNEHKRELVRLREHAEQQLREATRTIEQANKVLGDR